MMKGVCNASERVRASPSSLFLPGPLIPQDLRHDDHASIGCINCKSWCSLHPYNYLIIAGDGLPLYLLLQLWFALAIVRSRWYIDLHHLGFPGLMLWGAYRLRAFRWPFLHVLSK